MRTLAAVLLLLPALASADGVMWAPSRAQDLVAEQGQRAWVEWKDGRERLTVAVSPEEAASPLAWVVPVPAPAKDVRLTLAGALPDWQGSEIRAEALLALQNLGFPSMMVFVLLFFVGGFYYQGARGAPRRALIECLVVLFVFFVLSSIAVPKFGGGGPSAAADTVEVRAHAELSGLAAEVLAAPTPAALASYLRAKSADVPPAAVLKDEIARGGSFAVAWASAPSTARSLALELEFPSARPFYPMRLTSAYGATSLSADVRLDGWWRPAPEVDVLSAVKTGYYLGDDGRRFTRVVFQGAAEELASDWAFEPRLGSFDLQAAAAFAGFPSLCFFALWLMLSITAASLVGALLLPELGRGALVKLGVSQLVPFLGPAMALRRLRPAGLRGWRTFLVWLLVPGACLFADLSVLSRAARSWDISRAPVVLVGSGSLIERSLEAGTRGSLGTIRSALSVYYGDVEGYYPADLAALTARGKYLDRIPDAKTYVHPPSAWVQRMTSREYAAGAFHDTGGWAYVYEGPKAGTVAVDCAHTDSKGSSWTAY